MRFVRLLYGIYSVIIFLGIFILIYPFFVLFIQRDAWHKYGYFLNKLWAKLFFPMVFRPVKVDNRLKRTKGNPYIYIPNHSSYLDIPILAYAIQGQFLFVGKSSLAKIPLFGYMFRNLYISVNRESTKSRYETMVKSIKAIDKNRGVAIFAEGTIPRKGLPNMQAFKDGAFRIAIEKQIPIVPVTIPYNWIILPDNGSFIMKKHEVKIIIHEAIDTKGMTLDNLNELRDKTYNIIDQELRKHNKMN